MQPLSAAPCRPLTLPPTSAPPILPTTTTTTTTGVLGSSSAVSPPPNTGILITPASSPPPPPPPPSLGTPLLAPILATTAFSYPRPPPSPPPAMSSASSAPAEAMRATGEKLGRYLHRLPLLTRAVVVGVVGVYLLDVMGAPVAQGMRLDPKVMGLDQMHRLNTYPLVHHGFIHAAVNMVALVPLLERFEREVGTLKCVLLIAGPIVTFPAMLYLAVEMGVLKGNTAVEGASALVFTFLAMEAVKTFAFQPYYTIAGNSIPSWTTPLLWMMVAAFLIPGSSFLGHLCGLVIGYAYAWRYLRLLEPSEWILKKVEEKLGFVLLRLPWYIGLEKRTEMSWFEMLPMAAPPSGQAHGQGRTLGA